MDPQHPSHPLYARPSAFTTAPPPPRMYAVTSAVPGRTPPAYDPLGRRDHDGSRTTAGYGYPAVYKPEMPTPTRPLSPMRFWSLRPDAPSGYRVTSNLGSGVLPEGEVKETGGLYRDGRFGFFFWPMFFLFYGLESFFPLPPPLCPALAFFFFFFFFGWPFPLSVPTEDHRG
jgi:hypothetical protein